MTERENDPPPPGGEAPRSGEGHPPESAWGQPPSNETPIDVPIHDEPIDDVPIDDEPALSDQASPGGPADAEHLAHEVGLIFENAVEAIRADDGRYRMEAYQFVREALDWQVSRMSIRRHLSGPELLEGVKKLAWDRFGPMARTVLNHWGLVDGEDVGRIVFQLVDAGILSKTEDDRLDDFAGVVRFDDAFEAGYRWP
ncbi:MAG TPA: Minf_1886 family protein [Candidatus Eisenbacteria bacterium]